MIRWFLLTPKLTNNTTKFDRKSIESEPCKGAQLREQTEKITAHIDDIGEQRCAHDQIRLFFLRGTTRLFDLSSLTLEAQDWRHRTQGSTATHSNQTSKKAKPRDKDDSPSSPTSPRSSRRPLPAYPEWGHGIRSAREVKEERARSDRNERKHNHRFLASCRRQRRRTEGRRSTETPEKETEASMEARGERGEAQQSS